MNSQFYDGNASFSQSYLLSRIVRNAKGSQKIPFFIRESRLSSFQWTEPFSVDLQISGAAFSFSLEEKVRMRGFVRSDSPSPLPLY
jgi:hypothetical protein